MAPRALVHPGEVYARLTVVREMSERSWGQRVFECVCSCGVTVQVRASSLRNGHAKSCGCLRAEKATERVVRHNTTHGRCGTPEYRSWTHARARCLNPRDKSWPNWGGRGITMCQRYRDSFEAFIADLGEKPTSTHSVDRVNNDGHYSCGQCAECNENGWAMNLRWATPIQQRANRRPQRLRTHCRRGHELTPENTYESNGQRWCRTCKLDAERRRKQRSKPH